MGLAVYCARCHDHKFDPVPTADYYSLYGVLNSSYEPDEEDKPILNTGTTNGAGTGSKATYTTANPDYAKYLAEKAKLENGHEQFRLQNEFKYNNNSRANAATYMYWTTLWTKMDKRVRDNRREFEKILDEIRQREEKRTKTKIAKSKVKLMSHVGDTWQRYLSRKREDDRVFGPWVAYSNVATNQIGDFITADRLKAQ